MASRIFSSMALALALIAGSGCAFVIRTGSALTEAACDPASRFQAGDGSSGNPYQICAPEHFQNLGSTAGVYYKLTDDIDLSTVARITSFSGTLDGNGHTISGYNGALALFGTGTNIVLKNLMIKDFSMTGRPGSAVFDVVTIGSFEDVSLDSMVATDASDFGFLVGQCQQCSADTLTLTNSTVSGTDAMGGIFNVLEGSGHSVLKNITISGLSITTDTGAGAVAYNILDSEIVHANINATIISGSGGILAGAFQDSDAIDVQTAGSLIADTGCGGVIGSTGGTDVKIIQAVNSANVSCISGGSGAGIVGLNGANNLTITRSSNSGSITCGDNCAGIIGTSGTNLTVAHVRSTGQISGTAKVAGIVGRQGGVLNMVHTYSTSTLTSGGAIAGLVYSTGGTDVIFESYFDQTAAGTASDAGGTATAPAGMMDAATYWSYDDTQFWSITDGALPTLRSQDFLTNHVACDPGVARQGTGTLADPYLICASSHLTAGLLGYMKIVRDVSLLDFGPWTALGAHALTELDGNNQVVLGLDTSSGGTNVGFIEAIDPGMTVKDIHIHGAIAEAATDSTGILVAAMNGGTIIGSTVSGTLRNDGTDGAGGLVGLVINGVIADSAAYIRGTVLGISGYGGAIGVANSQIGTISISGVSTHAKLTDPSDLGGVYLGGLIGVVRAVSDGISIRDSHSGGSILGNAASLDYVGGLIGVAEESGATLIIDNAYSTIDSNGTPGSTNVGGFIGELSGGTITDSYALGSAAGERKIGGFLGGMIAGNVSRSFSTGATTCDAGGSGGFVGRIDGGTITNAYATGNATGPAVGGFAGGVTGGTISNAYAKGVVTISGGGAAGGFAESFSGGSFADCFFDMTTTTQATTAGSCTGLVTADMLLNATYAAWDLINIWNPPGGTAYPTLR